MQSRARGGDDLRTNTKKIGGAEDEARTARPHPLAPHDPTLHGTPPSHLTGTLTPHVTPPLRPTGPPPACAHGAAGACRGVQLPYGAAGACSCRMALLGRAVAIVPQRWLLTRLFLGCRCVGSARAATTGFAAAVTAFAKVPRHRRVGQ